jgi:hypothetical protein
VLGLAVGGVAGCRAVPVMTARKPNVWQMLDQLGRAAGGPRALPRPLPKAPDVPGILRGAAVALTDLAEALDAAPICCLPVPPDPEELAAYAEIERDWKKRR